LYPFTPTRPVSALRQGIFTVKERWEKLTLLQVESLTEDYLNLPLPQSNDEYLYVDATILNHVQQEADLSKAIFTLPPETVLKHGEDILAVRTGEQLSYPVVIKKQTVVQYLGVVIKLKHPWQLFQENERAIRDDFSLLVKNRTSEKAHSSNVLFGEENIFLEPGVDMRACIINAETGPVYIGKNAVIMEGTSIRGPVVICENASVKMGARLYGGTTIGPKCTAGGEIKNSILMANSNKGHDGYLGDSAIGEWCNFGAGTSNSNVKNTASQVKMWDGSIDDYSTAGKKAGLLMGDYSRSGINTSFNTGTVVGVCCHVFGHTAPSKHVPSFTWGNEPYNIEKALGDISRWKNMKGEQLAEWEEETLRKLRVMS